MCSMEFTHKESAHRSEALIFTGNFSEGLLAGAAKLMHVKTKHSLAVASLGDEG